MATTKMNAPKSETCWGSSFDLRSLNILLKSPFFLFSQGLALFSPNSRYRLLNQGLCTLKPPLLPCLYRAGRFHFFRHHLTLSPLIFLLLKSCSKLPSCRSESSNK